MSQNFEPNPDVQRVEPSPSAYDAPQPETIFADRTAPPPEALFADRAYYVVRWRSRRDTVYEGLNSVAETDQGGHGRVRAMHLTHGGERVDAAPG